MTTKYSIECWVLSPDNQVLLLQVPAREGKHEAFWQPVTGGIEAGETPAQAALREISEETGLKLDQADLTEIASDHAVVISPDLTISKTLYAARTPHTTITTNPGEHSDHQWVTPDAVADALFWDSNRDTWALVNSRQQLVDSHDGN
jgi:8-oxo-dGTP pyrophosphatase MutT (NUDIX family)